MSKPQIIKVPNFQVGIEFCLLNNYDFQFINVEQKILKFARNQKVYILKELEENDVYILNFNTEEVQNRKIFKENNIRNLLKIAKQYKYIAVENELKSIFINDFAYLTCGFYSASQEGQRWLALKNLKEANCDLDILRSIEIFKKDKQFNEEFCSYISCEWPQSLEELYIEFFNKEPSYVPECFEQEFYELFYAEVKNHQFKFSQKNQAPLMVDKSLISHIQEEVLYVGREEYIGAKNQVIYQPKFLGYPPFITVEGDLFFERSSEVNLYREHHVQFPSQSYFHANADILSEVAQKDHCDIPKPMDEKVPDQKNFYIEKDLAKGNFSRIYAKKLGLRSNESNEFNIYRNYRAFLKKLLIKICIEKEIIDFEEKFKIDAFHYKLLEKTYKFIAVFNDFVDNLRPKGSFFDQSRLKIDGNFNQVYWDFYSLEPFFCVDIVTSASNLNEYFVKKKYCSGSYYLLTEDSMVLVENYKEFILQDEFEAIFEDDLFYWVSL